jgi:zinc-finger of acetyl-transferase ESCO
MRDLVTCPICRLTYIPSSPDDRRIHRSRHAEAIKPRRPKPYRRFADGADVIVDERSPAQLHKLVYERARALQRDEGYGFPQWNPDCPPRGRGERMHAVLLVEDSTPIGAVSFEYVNWTNAPPGWHLNFAWIAPPWRLKGVMARRWPQARHLRRVHARAALQRGNGELPRQAWPCRRRGRAIRRERIRRAAASFARLKKVGPWRPAKSKAEWDGVL